MSQQFVSSIRTNNVNVKTKEFSSLLNVFAMIRHDALLYICQSC